LSTFKNRPLRARFGFALQGIAHGFTTEASLKAQAVFGVLAFLALLVLRPAALWWALFVLAASTVLAAELLNTAIEHLADELGEQHTAAIRIVKDCAAGAVLIAAAGAVGVAAAFLVHLINN
jgi:undecaprenol kinase